MPQHFRIFLSSPGDVPEERALAIKVIHELPDEPSLKDRVTLEAVAWEKPGAPPMEAGLTPQQAINAGLSKPSDCDVVVVILWSRMGTPLEFDGERYLSGTHYEYEEAMAASRANGKPRVLVYRRTDKVVFDADDSKLDEKQIQYQRVKDFFARFTDSSTGVITGGYNTYKTYDEFAVALKGHLLHLLERLADVRLQDELDSLLAEFLNEDTKDYRRQAILDRWGEIGEIALPAVIAAFRAYIIKHGGLLSYEFETNFHHIFKLFPYAAFSLIPELNHDDADVRFYTANTLAILMDAVSVSPLIQRLTDAEDYVRRAAAEALGRLNDPSAVLPLIERLTDVNIDVRRAAAEALGRLNDPSAVLPLIKRLTDVNIDVRRAALEALGRLNDPSAVITLIARLDDTNAGIRIVAAIALGRLKDSTAVIPLIARLDDNNENVRRAAANALGQLNDSTAVIPLIARLDDDESYVRKAAANLLGRLNDSTAVIPLIARLGDDNEDVRGEAAYALGQLKDSTAILPLIARLDDDNENVRSQAAVALGQLNDSTAILPLIAHLDDDSEYGRLGVAYALAQLGNAGGETILIANLAGGVPNSESDYDETIVEALRQIATPEALYAVEKWEQENNRTYDE
jgi:HEAT repeat protein